MNWKQFLKPTKEKIIVLVIVILVLYFSAPYTVNKNILAIVYIPILAIPILLGMAICTTDACPIDSILNVLLTIIAIIYSYLISCFIIWIHNKVKKK